jgi:LPXTG-site transpeptidase (sortase) family protein
MGKSKNKLKKDFGQFWLPVVVLVLFAGLVLFWNNISWMVNGDVWRQILSDAFPQYFSKPYVMAVKKPAAAAEQTQIIKNTTKQNATSTISSQTKPRRDMITIPKINITAPIVTAKTSDNDVIHELLDSGVVLYPGSIPFGQTGQTVILGHSAPAGWPKIKYDWVFSKLGDLKKGDMVVITYNYETRYYQVVKTRVVAPQEGVPAPTVTGNSLMLVSCWPPGKDLKRIAVETTIVDD